MQAGNTPSLKARPSHLVNEEDPAFEGCRPWIGTQHRIFEQFSVQHIQLRKHLCRCVAWFVQQVMSKPHLNMQTVLHRWLLGVFCFLCYKRISPLVNISHTWGNTCAGMLLDLSKQLKLHFCLNPSVLIATCFDSSSFTLSFVCEVFSRSFLLQRCCKEKPLHMAAPCFCWSQFVFKQLTAKIHTKVRDIKGRNISRQCVMRGEWKTWSS